MDTVTFSDNARWIWTPDASRRANNFVCFRRTFPVTGTVQKARLLITADARYELFVNGRWLGHGPARSWSSPWPVDEYDLRGDLHCGPNVVSVLVQDIGISTFQYILAAPGLLAGLELQDQKGQREVVTNTNWHCRPHPGYGWPVPRISCQQAWEEQFDARHEPGHHRWHELDYEAEGWEEAEVRGRPGEPPHEEFELRDIPMLTRERVQPRRLHTTEVVQPATSTWSLNPRPLLNPDDRTAGRLAGRMLLLSHIHSEAPQPIQFHALRGGEWKLNGEPLQFDDHSLQHTDSGVAHAELRPGWNALMCRMPEMTHLFSTTISFWTEEPVQLSARPAEDQEQDDTGQPPWLALGPYAEPQPDGNDAMGKIIRAGQTPPDATPDRFESTWEKGEVGELEPGDPLARRLGPTMATPVDACAITASDRPVTTEQLRVEQPQALLSNNAQWSTVHPPEDGGDARLLLDFGDEVVGYHEFEIDAPEGTILDNQNFEFIQRDGRFNLAEGMNNSFRYICREGPQRYRTFVRRGFRYCWLVLRNFDRPVRIRSVRAIFSTYPVDGQGEFSCSDLLLERMWNSGARTLRCCAEDTYTDCPTYEQTHWVGDARNEALVDLLANGDSRLSRHCWLQAARSLDRSPMVECHVPSGWPCILTAWSLLWMRWAQEHFLLTGDEELAGEMLQFIERNVCGLEQHINADDLLEIQAWNMLDWAPMDTPNEGIVTHQNCLSVLALRQAADLARRLEHRGRSQRWVALADRMSNAINSHLWSVEREAYLDCIHADGRPSDILSQQTHTIAYLSGVAREERAKRCIDAVIEPPEEFVTSGSPFFMFFALEAMARAGRHEVLLQTVRNYWRPQVEAGATTFWEAYWPEKERKTRSHCHAWSSAPTFFLPREILGVKPLQPGYARVRIAPHPCDLRWAHGRVPTPRGTVECRWERADGEFRLDLRLPADTPARIELPFAGTVSIQEGEAESLESPEGQTHLECCGGRLRMVLNL